MGVGPAQGDEQQRKSQPGEQAVQRTGTSGKSVRFVWLPGDQAARGDGDHDTRDGNDPQVIAQGRPDDHRNDSSQDGAQCCHDRHPRDREAVIKRQDP